MSAAARILVDPDEFRSYARQVDDLADGLHTQVARLRTDCTVRAAHFGVFAGWAAGRFTAALTDAADVLGTEVDLLRVHAGAVRATADDFAALDSAVAESFTPGQR